MSKHNPYQPGQYHQQGAPQNYGQPASAIEGFIPYKNAPALIGYYLAVFSLIPFLGLPLSIGAIILGVIGLMKRKSMPNSKGSAHAIVAVVLGTITLILWGGLILLGLVSIFMNAR